jgi:energy-converting hydrogenase Eha subunit C
MLRTKTDRKTAILGIIGILAAVLILSVWPFRMYSRSRTVSQKESPAGSSAVVQKGLDAGEYFRAADTHLRTVSFYLAECTAEGTASFRIYDNTSGTPKLLCDHAVDIRQKQGAGWIDVPVDIDTVPGSEYIAIFNVDDDSQFRLGYALPADSSSDYEIAFYNDAAVDGYQMLLKLQYRRPLGTAGSLLAIVLVIAAAAAAAVCVTAFYRHHPGKNRETTVERVMQISLTPAVVILGTAAFAAVWPLRLFDRRMPDILLYETGIVITVLICLFGIWHDRSGLPDMLNRRILREHWTDGLQAALIAAVIAFGCEYMNGTYELQHTLSERKMTIAFLLLILSVGAWKKRTEKGLKICLAVSSGAAAVYGMLHTVPASAKDSAAQNTALFLLCICGILLSAVIFLEIRDIRAAAAARKTDTAGGKGKSRGLQVCYWYTVPLLLLFVFLVLRRNTRWWPLVLTVMLALFYIRFAFWDKKDRWLDILTGGILLHFVCNVIWCMLHRYYMAFLFERFSMNFFTVTVTAEYLTIVEGAAAALLIGKLCTLEETGFRRMADRIWKEALLFGTASVYLFFTLSRTGIAAAAAAVLCVLLAAAIRDRKETAAGSGRKMLHHPALRALGIMVLSSVLLFAPVFTLQRILPAVNGRPMLFEGMEEYPDDVMTGGVKNWDSMHFMCIERFRQVMGNKLFGLPEGTYDYDSDTYTENDGGGNGMHDTPAQPAENGNLLAYAGPLHAGLLTADPSGAPDGGKTAGGRSVLFLADASEDSPQNSAVEDYTNGRLSIYRSYIEGLNLTGHDTMGAVLEDGSVSVHAHDTYLQVAWDHGIPVGIWFFIVLVLTFIRSSIYYSKTKRQSERTGLLPMAETVGFAVAAVVEWVFQYSNPMTAVLFLAIAPLLFERTEKTIEN